MRCSLDVRSAMRLAMFVSALVGLPVATSLAAITVQGDVDPADSATWNSYPSYINNAHIGKTTNGQVTLDGVGTTVNIDYLLSLGASGGHGTLNIGTGSLVNVGYGNNYTALLCGLGVNEYGPWGTKPLGTGSIHFDNGTLQTGCLVAGVSDLSGTGVINTNGLISDVDLVFDAAHGANQTFALNSHSGQNIVVNLSIASSGNGSRSYSSFYSGAGYRGSSTMLIADRSRISSDIGLVGVHEGSNGTVTVNGTYSSWNVNQLIIGRSGYGKVNIVNGGTLSHYTYPSYPSTSSRIAVSNGEFNIDGTGSVWYTGQQFPPMQSIEIGRDEIGRDTTAGYVNITNGGQVKASSSTTTTPSYYQQTVYLFNGGIRVDGHNSSWSDIKSIGIGVGYNLFKTTLSITNGGAVYGGGAVIGMTPYSNSSVVIDGTGSRWSAQYLCLGGINTNANASSLSGLPIWVTDDGRERSASIKIANGGTLSSSSADIGYFKKAIGKVTVDGNNSSWINGYFQPDGRAYSSQLNVGGYGQGILNITNGGSVTSLQSMTIGYNSGSSGIVNVDGTNSLLTIGYLYQGYYDGTWLNIGGSSGNGVLNITNGGALNCLLYSFSFSSIGNSGSVSVAGNGSKWLNSSGISNSGNLLIHRGGLVTAQSVSINNQSLLSMDIGFESTLNINNGTGTLVNEGKVRFTAAANVAAGEYQPILAGTFAGSGIYQALGGRWDNTRHVFIVDAAETGSIDDTINLDLTSSRRAAITDATSGQTLVGASFLSGTGSISFAADELTGSEESALSLMLTAGSDLLAGYQFTVTGTTIDSTNPVYLSLFVGRDYDEDTFKLWHYDGATWTAFLPTDLSYDGLFASFTVTGFSGYAISGELIPEPASLGLLALSSVVLLMRRPSLKK